MFELRSFGVPTLLDGESRPVEAVVSQPKRLVLLALVAIGHPDGCRRDTLLSLFWPESAMGAARNSLRQALTMLRRHLGPETLPDPRGEVVRVDPSRLQVDAIAFERAVQEENLDRAVALYRGDFLAGLHLSGSPEVERWIDDRRATYRRRAVRAALRLAEAHRGGDSSMAVSLAHWAVDNSPLDEPAWRKLIGFQIARGDHAAALATYERLVKLLAEEFDAVPAPETQALIAGLRKPSGP